MFGFFGKKPVLDAHARHWLAENFEWAMRNCSTGRRPTDVVLVHPDNEFLPEKHEDQSLLIKYVFDRLRYYAGLDDWPIELIEKEENPNPHIGPTLVVQDVPYEPPIDILLPEYDGDPIFIEYSLELAANMEGLVSAFAYELSRIYFAYVEEDPPGEEDTTGHSIEIIAVFFGFGIILANSAIQYKQYTNLDTQGWSFGSAGYLSQYELTYALAMYCELMSVDTSVVRKSLKSDLMQYFENAREELISDEKIMWRLKNLNNARM